MASGGRTFAKLRRVDVPTSTKPKVNRGTREEDIKIVKWTYQYAMSVKEPPGLNSAFFPLAVAKSFGALLDSSAPIHRMNQVSDYTESKAAKKTTPYNPPHSIYDSSNSAHESRFGIHPRNHVHYESLDLL